MRDIQFDGLADIDSVLAQIQRYLLKYIMTKADAVGGLDRLENHTGIEKLARDVNRGKVSDMLRIAKQL